MEWTETVLPLHPSIEAQPESSRGREITSLLVHDGYLLAGYGDGNANTGPLDLAAWKLDTLEPVVLMEDVQTEEFAPWVLIDGKAYSGYIDPKWYWGPGGFISDETGSWAMDHSLPDMVHCTSPVEFKGDLYVAGTSLNVETEHAGHLSIARRRNGSWTQHHFPYPNPFQNVFWGSIFAVVDDVLYYSDWDGNVWKTEDGDVWTDHPTKMAAGRYPAVNTPHAVYGDHWEWTPVGGYSRYNTRRYLAYKNETLWAMGNSVPPRLQYRTGNSGWTNLTTISHTDIRRLAVGGDNEFYYTTDSNKNQVVALIGVPDPDPDPEPDPDPDPDPEYLEHDWTPIMKVKQFRTLEPDGTLPSEAVAQVQDLVEANSGDSTIRATGRPDMPETTPYTEEELNALPLATMYYSTNWSAVDVQGPQLWVKYKTPHGADGWKPLVGYRRLLATTDVPGINVVLQYQDSTVLVTVMSGAAAAGLNKMFLNCLPEFNADSFNNTHISGKFQPLSGSNPITTWSVEPFLNSVHFMTSDGVTILYVNTPAGFSENGFFTFSVPIVGWPAPGSLSLPAFS